MKNFTKILTAAAFSVAAGTASAAVVDGHEDFTDNGGTWTLAFDGLGADIDGTGDGIIFDLAFGVTVTVTTTTGTVVQDWPADGGLGVYGDGINDNLETGAGEDLILTFSHTVDIQGITFNGNHTDDTTGVVNISDGILAQNHFAGLLDGVAANGEGSDQGVMCDSFGWYCGTKTLTFSMNTGGYDDFTGYLESITISAIPLPAGALMLLTGLGGLVVARRRKS